MTDVRDWSQNGSLIKSMRCKRALVLTMAVAGTWLSAGASLGQETNASQASKQIGVAMTRLEPSLIVLNSRAAKLTDGRLVLVGVSTNSVVFADRPVRAAGHVLTAHLLEEWARGPDSFAKDPPNATVSVFSREGSSVSDVVVTLKSPKLDGDTLTFAVELLEGNLDDTDGPASTFIDIVGMPLTPVSFAGAARRAAVRGAWYAGAPAGVTAAAEEYRPRCGYYPHPPCY